MTFSGLSAFPLTPRREGSIDLHAMEALVARAVAAGVDSIGALGSTGSYAYLSRTQRAAVARTAVQAAGDVPVIVGVGAISTAAVLASVEDATDAGAAGILLTPVSYQPLLESEVYALFEDVTTRFPDTPVVLYDNPATSGFTFSDELRISIAHLPSVASIKLGALPEEHDEAVAYIKSLRGAIPADVSLGISGDAAGARGLNAGCDAWYGVLGGIFPDVCRRLVIAAQAGDRSAALDISDSLAPIWALFAKYGSYRVVAAVATLSGVLSEDAVYAPVLPLYGAARDQVAAALARVDPAR